MKVPESLKKAMWTQEGPRSWEVGKGSPWKVWDTGTGVTIASGTGTDSRKVGGLYGTYKAKLTDACWRDSIYISN